MKEALRIFLAAILGAVLACAGGDAPRVAPATAAGSGGWEYALVLEASSSATTLAIYQWRPGDDGRLPRIRPAPEPRAGGEEPWSRRVKPGLSAYAGRPLEAARSLEPLVDYALGVIPAQRRAATTVHLWATAGLRLLPAAEAGEILSAVERVLAATPFRFAGARVLSGAEEGVYGWLAVNYLMGHLEHGGPFPTVGVLDLGGASTQITFAPLDHPRDHGQAVALGGKVYRLYSHSYLGLGQDVVRDELAAPACYPRGYALPGGGGGSGDFDACRQAVRERLARPCAVAPCSGLGAYQPPLYGDFLGLSVYAYTADFFRLGGRLVPAELAAAGRDFCATSWPETVAADPAAAGDPFRPRYCFAAAYIVELLTGGFGFTAATERIHAPLAIQGTETGWTLGALLYALAGESD